MQDITKRFKGLAEISTYLRKENPTFLYASHIYVFKKTSPSIT